MDKLSYALGLGIGRQLAQMGATGLDIDDFAMAIKDVLAGRETKVADSEAQTIVQEFFRKQEEKANAAMAEKGKKAKAEGEQYLAENAARRMDRRPATDAGRSQVPLLHTLPARLRRARRGRVYTAVRNPRVRRGAYSSSVINQYQ